MSKLTEQDQQGNPDNPQYAFYCPGCKCHHWFKTTGNSPRWTFNGNMDQPTVRPSILVNHGVYPDGDLKTVNGKVAGYKKIRCHLFITDGKIQYLSDCTHELAGQTIEMQEET
jgi:hypothetical protein